MTWSKRIELVGGLKELVEGDKGFWELLHGVVLEVLEAEMDEALGGWEVGSPLDAVPNSLPCPRSTRGLDLEAMGWG
jgi:hypothetical protein